MGSYELMNYRDCRPVKYDSTGYLTAAQKDQKKCNNVG